MPPQPTLKHTAGLNSLLTAWAAIHGLHHLLWTAHWVSEGDPQYGDHLLYQRLYEARVMEIDGIAEQLVLMGGPAAVNPAESWAMAGQFIDGIAAAPHATMARSILAATQLALTSVNKAERAYRTLDDGQYSLGVVNLLSGIAQSLNEAIYLLGRRVKI